MSITPEKIKEAASELSKEVGLDKPENPFKKLHYATAHLPYYHEFSSLIGLYGRHYIPIIKIRWYQLHGGIIQKPVRVGSLKTDTRLQVAYPLVTEGGKNELIYSIKSLIARGIEKGKGEQFQMSEPISYSPESLVGKMVERMIDNPKVISGEVKTPKKILQRVENLGHFNNDFLEFDECTQLITSDSPEMQQAREYLSKAENPMGMNEVEKRLVDDLKTETIKYKPSCSNSYYFQPFEKLPESCFLQGFMRRKLIPVGNVELFLNFADESMYSSKLEDNNFSESDYRERIISHLELVRTTTRQDFIFTEKAKKLIQEYALYISAQGKMHSDKIANFCKISKFTSLANLIKLSAIIAGSYYSNIVDENCVALAYMDLVEFMQNTFDFISTRALGDFSYGTGWNGANYKQKEALLYLYNKKAFSRESSNVSIAEFVKIVEHVFGLREDQARNKYLAMKNSLLIDSAQTGMTESKVWLKIKPEEHKEYLEGCKGLKGFTTYDTLFCTLNDLITPLQSLQPLQPLKLNNASK